MIRASQIIMASESLLNPEDDLELLSTLYPILEYLSDSIGSPLSSVWYSVLKRYAPDAIYTGPGYRFIGLESFQTVKEGIHESDEEAELHFPPDRKKTISLFKNYDKGRYQSWALTTKGIEEEIGKQSYAEHIFLFKANLSGGIYLKRVAEHALKVAMRCRVGGQVQVVAPAQRTSLVKPPLSIITVIEHLKNFRSDFGGSEEVLAPMPNQVDLIGYYEGQDVRDTMTLGKDTNDLVMNQRRLDISLSLLLEPVGRALDMNYKLVKKLLDAGADPDNELGYDTERPLKLAIDKDDPYLITLLLKAGASLKFQCGMEPDTPLMYASKFAEPKTLEALIDGGSDVNEIGEGNWTAIMLAVAENQYSNADLLYERGAKTDIRNEDGETVFDMGWEPRK